MKIITSPQAELDRLIAQARIIGEQTRAQSTKRAYASDFTQFEQWCTSVDLDSLPALPETVAMYIVHLDQLGRKPSTIRRHLISISRAHKLAGYGNPVNAQVLELKKGINRIRGIAQKKKSPLTLEHLRRVIDSTPPDFLGTRDKAVLLVGWTAALRRSELCGIDLEDLEELPEGIAITIERSKTDQEGAGRKIGLPFIDQEQTLCSARALNRWIKVAQIDSGAVFCGVGKGGKDRFFGMIKSRLEPSAVSTIVKRAVKRAGYDPRYYSGHSLRGGLATSLAASGIEERRIMEITGHTSLTTLREYIHRGTLFRDHPVLSLFSSSSDE